MHSTIMSMDVEDNPDSVVVVTPVVVVVTCSVLNIGAYVTVVCVGGLQATLHCSTVGKAGAWNPPQGPQPGLDPHVQLGLFPTTMQEHKLSGQYKDGAPALAQDPQGHEDKAKGRRATRIDGNSTMVREKKNKGKVCYKFAKQIPG